MLLVVSYPDGWYCSWPDPNLALRKCRIQAESGCRKLKVQALRELLSDKAPSEHPDHFSINTSTIHTAAIVIKQEIDHPLSNPQNAYGHCAIPDEAGVEGEGYRYEPLGVFQRLELIILPLFMTHTALQQGHISRPIAVVQKKTMSGVGKDRDEAVPFWDK
jgi:hypothetical protein